MAQRRGHLLEAVSKVCDDAIQMIDCPSIRAHQRAENANKTNPVPLHRSLARRSDNQDPYASSMLWGSQIFMKRTEGKARGGRGTEDMFSIPYRPVRFPGGPGLSMKRHVRAAG
jgi:hypothetical protein